MEVETTSSDEFYIHSFIYFSLYAVELNQMDSDPKNICQAADTQQKCNKMRR